MVQSKCKHHNMETRNNNNITINQMPSTRSGEMNYQVGPEHHGQYAGVSGTFASGNGTKRKMDKSRKCALCVCIVFCTFFIRTDPAQRTVKPTCMKEIMAPMRTIRNNRRSSSLVAWCAWNVSETHCNICVPLPPGNCPWQSSKMLGILELNRNLERMDRDRPHIVRLPRQARSTSSWDENEMWECVLLFVYWSRPDGDVPVWPSCSSLNSFRNGWMCVASLSVFFLDTIHDFYLRLSEFSVSERTSWRVYVDMLLCIYWMYCFRNNFCQSDDSRSLFPVFWCRGLL
jgi:hypothetical protein